MKMYVKVIGQNLPFSNFPSRNPFISFKTFTLILKLSFYSLFTSNFVIDGGWKVFVFVKFLSSFIFWKFISNRKLIHYCCPRIQIYNDFHQIYFLITFLTVKLLLQFIHFFNENSGQNILFWSSFCPFSKYSKLKTFFNNFF